MPRLRTRSVVAAAVAVTALTASAVWYAVTRTDEAVLDAALAARLDAHVTPLIERRMSEEWTSRPHLMACAVRPVGVDPELATTFAEVTTVYVWASCETLMTEPGGTVVPVAVHLGPPVRFDVPSDADWGTGRVTGMFPDRLHDALLTGEHPDGLPAELKARKRELS
ncbi:hypothetical protein [Actinoplanes sp. NPDC049802]|uniref:hypothetical protein n=1 Tax=Actinoplanes sp. NPDC049802 TaxID=3154742 RepID=UPI003400CF37